MITPVTGHHCGLAVPRARENAVFEQLAPRPEHAAARCIGRPRPHRRDAHRGRRRFSSQTGNGRYCRARYYHPGLQRFISEDPIGFAGGDSNLYAYVFNDPIGLRDASGMVVDPISWTAAAIMCGGGATVGMSVTVLSGRKPTLENLAAGAAIGCGTGMLMLVSWIAAAGAGAVATSADLDLAASALVIKSTAEQISKGHAFVKHVVERGEFPGIRTREQFAEVIERTMSKAEYVRELSNGRTAYWKDGVIVIRNRAAADGGTASKKHKADAG